MQRTLSVWGSIACLLLVHGTCAGQYNAWPLDRRIVDDEAKMQAWYGERNELWGVLLRDAGKPRHGAILELRLVEPVNDRGQLTDLVVSVKNVCSRPIKFYVSSPTADVLVRDDAGRMVRLTTEGLYYFSGPRIVTSLSTLELKPGYAWGFVVRLRKYFKIADPGTYTVLARTHYDGDINGTLIASAVTPKTGKKPAANGDANVAQGQAASTPPESRGQSSAADKEWTGLLREAGQLHRGCILEVMMSPETPTKLVASLTCLSISGHAEYGSKWEPGNGLWHLGDSADGRADAGRQPADYRVLVHDPDGKPVKLTSYGRLAVAAVEVERCNRLETYEAIGAVIPLAKWFDMTKPGEYTVLVTLQAPDEKRRVAGRHNQPFPADEHGPLWVAKPIKYRVVAKPK